MTQIPESQPSAPADAHPTAGRSSRVLIRADSGDRGKPWWLEFRDPIRILETRDIASVVGLIEEVETALGSGLYAAGFVTYEAAPAFDPALTTHSPGRLPLAWFGLYREVRRHHELPWAAAPSEPLDWQPTIGLAEYRRAVHSVHRAIEEGNSYQANLTFRLRAPFDGDPWSLFAAMINAQPVGYAAYLEIDGHVICSASPELFFRLHDSRITARPMKGTARRGLTVEDDRRLALQLADSRKDRAENLMIVDMVRNDLGRIAVPGSVAVESLFDLETYESVHQLTSGVAAVTTASAAEIFRALFPCASITGAPKVETMALLAGLEASPRGIYTGTIGYVTPDREAQFNVAIRTVHVDLEQQAAEYGTGSGIVWDSVADDEYRECEAKALVLDFQRPEFALLETLRRDGDDGYFLLDRHLDRLAGSAEYFGFPFDRQAAVDKLDLAAASCREPTQRARLLLHRDGRTELEIEPLAEREERLRHVALARTPVDRTDVFLYHKSTVRGTYDEALRVAPGFDDVVLWNEDGFLTESTIANLVFAVDGRRFTPPVDHGLLPGTFRAELIARGELAIKPLHRRDLAGITELWLVNSVRGWTRVGQVDEYAPPGFRAVWRNTVPSDS